MISDVFPAVPFRRWFFVNTSTKESVESLFERWSIFVKKDWDSFRAAEGGSGTEPDSVRTPDGRVFRAFSYNKDFTFWRNSWITFCDAENLDWGEIVDGFLVVSDRSRIPIEACSLEK